MSSKLTYKDFIKEVKAELVHIRDNAGNARLNRLKLETLDVSYPSKCVYGRMFGYANNAAARDFYKKCYSSAAFTKDKNAPFTLHGMPKSYIAKNAPHGLNITQTRESIAHLTPLEVFLFGADTDQLHQIIDFLQGRRKNIGWKRLLPQYLFIESQEPQTKPVAIKEIKIELYLVTETCQEAADLEAKLIRRAKDPESPLYNCKFEVFRYSRGLNLSIKTAVIKPATLFEEILNIEKGSINASVS